MRIMVRSNWVANYINANTSNEDSASDEHSDDEDDDVSVNNDNEVEEETTVPVEGLLVLLEYC
jgi:hypothetical protein